MSTPDERLKASRKAAGFKSAAAFARHLSKKYPEIEEFNEVTYRSHEASPIHKNHRGFSEYYARYYGPELNKEWWWLLYGDNGEPLRRGPATRIKAPSLVGDVDITEADFADAFLPLVRKIAGEDASKAIKSKEIRHLAHAAQATLREWKGELASDLTSHLALFLLGSAVTHALAAGREPSMDQASRLSRQAAAYLMELGADGQSGGQGGGRKSG